MFGGLSYKRDERTEQERYLQDEVDSYREREERQRRERDEERESRRREFRGRMQMAERTADNWPDALQKQIGLCRREITGLAGESDFDEFFENEAEACERALIIWRDVESVKALEADDLRARLLEIDSEIESEVAKRLEAENPKYKNVAQQIQDGSPSEFLNW